MSDINLFQNPDPSQRDPEDTAPFIDFQGISDFFKFKNMSPAEQEIYRDKGMTLEEYQQSEALKGYERFKKNPFRDSTIQFDDYKEQAGRLAQQAEVGLRNALAQASLYGGIDEADLSDIYKQALGTAQEGTAQLGAQIADAQAEDVRRRGQTAYSRYMGVPSSGPGPLAAGLQEGLQRAVTIALPLLISDSLLNTKTKDPVTTTDTGTDTEAPLPQIDANLNIPKGQYNIFGVEDDDTVEPFYRTLGY